MLLGGSRMFALRRMVDSVLVERTVRYLAPVPLTGNLGFLPLYRRTPENPHVNPGFFCIWPKADMKSPKR